MQGSHLETRAEDGCMIHKNQSVSVRNSEAVLDVICTECPTTMMSSCSTELEWRVRKPGNQYESLLLIIMLGQQTR